MRRRGAGGGIFRTGGATSNKVAFGATFPASSTGARAVAAAEPLASLRPRKLCTCTGGRRPSRSRRAGAGTPTILVSTNGGVKWSQVALPGAPPFSAAALTTTLGAILSISPDASGKAVYAVGAPAGPGSATYVNAGYLSYLNGAPPCDGTVFISASSAGSVALTVSTPAAGTILVRTRRVGRPSPVLPSAHAARGPTATRTQFSNAYGASGTWALQSAPVLPGMCYALAGVAALRSTLAFAAGGNPYGSFQTYSNGAAVLATGLAAENGVIIATFNGGFSWTQMARGARRGRSGALRNRAFAHKHATCALRRCRATFRTAPLAW